MKRIIKISGIIFLVILAMTGCNFFSEDPVSPTDRLTDFKINLNTDSRLSTIDHLHSEAQLYDQINGEPNWWNSTYFSTDYNNFEFIDISVGTAINGIISVTAIISNSSATWATLITFKEEIAGDDVWLILSITFDPDGLETSPGPFEIIY